MFQLYMIRHQLFPRDLGHLDGRGRWVHRTRLMGLTEYPSREMRVDFKLVFPLDLVIGLRSIIRFDDWKIERDSL